MMQTMQQVVTIAELRQHLKEARRQGKRVGLVPTMGYLHEGHLSLVNEAKKHCEIVVMSIFVNPLQFGPNEDFDRYPRDMERDLKMAASAGVDFVFSPSVGEMYPQQVKTNVSVSGVSEPLCGRSRPGHFDGVATVVLKLFQIVQPDYAFFGQKDAQQVAVVEQMVRDLSVPVTIIPCPIVREADGVAMSSRNVYLSAEERKQAAVLYRSLQLAEKKVASGADLDSVRDEMIRTIKAEPLADIDYVELLRYPDLTKPEAPEKGDRVLIALAVRFGKTRLIDNVIVTV
ncbi:MULTISPECIES: pantoate--beta-alanine ligase [Brevibacillus]|jgi:pantoate--beta-alanine ligase|uniref:pantoate--beta-alanine ligase n=1 Tax=Brevibacillus TaxID=55080 RepID=UPI0004F36565|nr:pantoate--beta-alanine ligase [Brevibacillus borstelensis]KKX53061.1 pantoate--beta-alanine ligase [Brevibacillus borstelensis cifa_chp40]MCM3590889.1 pantoate--beta-alanine ligase [Brevibacillus borstelensis]MCM3620896.1 pantoate--beta-alanine ligase [Brevibacillus borstelensis]MED1850997.1 pantoate--beta-alanine ligase [Brevibacillus borstelensis]MED1874870.1 pantoate--beta-alanine ligase [Brevibacillus borstelensis]